MQKIKCSVLIIAIASFININAQSMNQNGLNNEKVKNYEFLEEMYKDDYFPNTLVNKGKQILIDLCAKIESEYPKSPEELYSLTQAATDQFNDLQEEFNKHDSEIETAARECIASDFEFIAKAYGFKADTEMLIATRDW